MRWFLADPHFGHASIIKMMARINKDTHLFSCGEEHDSCLINHINANVDRADELYILGDFANDRPGVYRSQITCRQVFLIWGNHDKIQASKNVFSWCKDTYVTKLRRGGDTLRVVLSHYPHAYWDGSHRGWGHLYGHCHGQREEELEFLYPDRRALDIGVDHIFNMVGAYRPLSEVELFDYFSRRGGHDDIRFYHDFQAALYLSRGLI